jgi:hypothetical protein
MGGYGWLPLEGPVFAIAGPLLLVIQVACLVHVIKTGRPYWWLWIIFGFPLVGLAAYVFLEVRPSWGRFDLQSLLWNFKSSGERIAILESRLEDSGTVRNRLALVAELQRAGLYDRQCEILSEGLRGAFADDAGLLMRLAQAHLEAGRPGEAERILQNVSPQSRSDMQFQLALLRARVLAGQGRHGEAEPLFQELVARKKSEAPRYYYAEFLIATQRQEEAIAVLQDIRRQYRRGTPVWRHQERQWFHAARRLLQAP